MSGNFKALKVKLTNFSGSTFDYLEIDYKKYYRLVFKIAYDITEDSYMAEDVAQDTFLKYSHFMSLTYGFPKKIPFDFNVKGFLCTVAKNTAYSALRKEAKTKGLNSDVLIFQSFTNLDADFQKRSEFEDVRRAVTSLPLDKRGVVFLFYINDLSIKEISEIFDIGEGTVKSRLHYARKRMQAKLKETPS